MEVINKTFAGTTRAGRCSCVCRSSDTSFGGAYNEGYTSYGCGASCNSDVTYNYEVNWNRAVSYV